MNDSIQIRLVFASLSVLFILYTTWVYLYGTESNIAMNNQAKKGKLLWQKYHCTACHQIYGLGGYLGPDLTSTVALKGEDYVKVMMRSAKNQMPSFDMSDEECESLVEYLKYVSQTGDFPNNNTQFTWYGSFEIEDNK